MGPAQDGWIRDNSEKVVGIFQTSGDVLLGAPSRKGEWPTVVGEASSVGEALRVSGQLCWLLSRIMCGSLCGRVWKSKHSSPFTTCSPCACTGLCVLTGRACNIALSFFLKTGGWM